MRDAEDNCPRHFNPEQADSDQDGFGNACDPCIFVVSSDVDSDGDGAGDRCDCDADADGCNNFGHFTNNRREEVNCEASFGNGRFDEEPIIKSPPACGNSTIPRDCTNDDDADGVFDDAGPTCHTGETGCTDNCPCVVNPDQTDSDGTADNQICGVSIEPHGDACAPPAEGQVKSVLANVCDQNESVTFTPPARLPALGPIPQVCLPDAVGGGRCGRAGVIGARCTLPYECVAGGPSCSVRDPVINPASSLLVLERGVGNPRWQISAASLGLTSAFGLDGTLYVGSLNGRLYALGTNGSVKWSVQTGGPIVSSPLVDIGGMLYVGSDDGKLYAIDTSTGRVTFTTSTGGAVKSSPALDSQGRLYVGSDANALLAIGG